MSLPPFFLLFYQSKLTDLKNTHHLLLSPLLFCLCMYMWPDFYRDSSSKERLGGVVPPSSLSRNQRTHSHPNTYITLPPTPHTTEGPALVTRRSKCTLTKKCQPPANYIHKPSNTHTDSWQIFFFRSPLPSPLSPFTCEEVKSRRRASTIEKSILHFFSLVFWFWACHLRTKWGGDHNPL